MLDSISRAFDAFYRGVVILLVAFAVIAPFGLWKIGELVFALCKHLSIGWK